MLLGASSRSLSTFVWGVNFLGEVGQYCQDYTPIHFRSEALPQQAVVVAQPNVWGQQQQQVYQQQLLLQQQQQAYQQQQQHLRLQQQEYHRQQMEANRKRLEEQQRLRMEQMKQQQVLLAHKQDDDWRCRARAQRFGT